VALEFQRSSYPRRMNVVYLRAADKLCREKLCSVFCGSDVAGCRIVDVKNEAKPAYEYSIGH
jgi:hypothetical protein